MKTTIKNMKLAVDIANAVYVKGDESKIDFYLRMFGLDKIQELAIYDSFNEVWLSTGVKQAHSEALNDLVEGDHSECFCKSLLRFDATARFWWVDPKLSDEIFSTFTDTIEKAFVCYLSELASAHLFSAKQLDESICRIAIELNELHEKFEKNLTL